MLLNLLVLFPGALLLASAGVGGYTYIQYSIHIWIDTEYNVGKTIMNHPFGNGVYTTYLW